MFVVRNANTYKLEPHSRLKNPEQIDLAYGLVILLIMFVLELIWNIVFEWLISYPGAIILSFANKRKTSENFAASLNMCFVVGLLSWIFLVAITILVFRSTN